MIANSKNQHVGRPVHFIKFLDILLNGRQGTGDVRKVLSVGFRELLLSVDYELGPASQPHAAQLLVGGVGKESHRGKRMQCHCGRVISTLATDGNLHREHAIPLPEATIAHLSSGGYCCY